MYAEGAFVFHHESAFCLRVYTRISIPYIPIGKFSSAIVNYQEHLKRESAKKKSEPMSWERCGTAKAT